MTLCTRIAVTTPGIDPQDALNHLTTLLGATPEQIALATKGGPDPDSEYAWDRERPHSLNMPLGLGLPALAWVDYSPTDEVIALSEYETRDLAEARDRDTEKMYAPPAHLVFHFDTSYFYKAPNGAGCGDLHAWIVREVGAWLTERGASWDWYDESGRGWTVEWKNDTTFFAQYPDVSAEWGTLGDPDVGELGSMIPSASGTRDQQRAFLEDLVRPALGLNLD